MGDPIGQPEFIEELLWQCRTRLPQPEPGGAGAALRADSRFRQPLGQR